MKLDKTFSQFFDKISGGINAEGNIIEIGPRYDVSDLANNPVVIFDSDGVEISGGLAVYSGNVIVSLHETHWLLTIRTAELPATYSMTSGGGAF